MNSSFRAKCICVASLWTQGQSTSTHLKCRGSTEYAHELELQRLCANKYSLKSRQRQLCEAREGEQPGETSEDSDGEGLKTPGLTTLF